MYLKGLLENDGEKAMTIFSKLYNTHPTSDYGDDAVMKVSEYYYAAGLYIQAANWLKKMPIYYSRSEHIDRAVKLFLNSLIVSGHKDTAIFYSRVFKRQFPQLDVDGKINELLHDFEESDQAAKEANEKLSEISEPVITRPIDTTHEMKIQAALKILLEGRTSFVIAHRLNTIVNADQIVVLEDGKVIENGSHQDLLAIKGSYYNLYTMQWASNMSDS